MWYKKEPLSSVQSNNKEIWSREIDGKTLSFEVDTYLGKKTDLLSLKKNIVDNLKDKVKYYQESRKEIYKPDNVEDVESCPVCQESAKNTNLEVDIYGAQYASCNNCSHVYVLKRPTNTTIEGFYLNDVTYAATYTDKKSAESRLNAIAVPWRDWMIEVYTKAHGEAPKKILDVGSGAGHFVEACRRAGMEADGVELSQSSRDFAKEIWGIELDGRDFVEVAKEYGGYDVVTFWGLLEHTPNPGQILSAAYDIVSQSKGGMVISKVPRWDSLSAAIQILNNDTIIRHLDPMGHIMCFTDSSAAELYHKCGFSPNAAWYYGMDVYETFMQLGHTTDNYAVLTETGDLQTELQQFIDDIKYSDGLTLAGVPNK